MDKVNSSDMRIESVKCDQSSPKKMTNNNEEANREREREREKRFEILQSTAASTRIMSEQLGGSATPLYYKR
jgi:hypothetical protein